MNLVLLLLLIAQICLGICAWLSPHLLRAIAAHLLTRADVIDASRVESRRRLRFWSGELGLNLNLPRDENDTEPATEVYSQRAAAAGSIRLARRIGV